MDNNLDSFFAAFADSTRRAVIEQLTEGPAAVSELHSAHDMALPSFMKHLGRLEATGLIETEKTGRTRTVRLNATRMIEAEDWIKRQRLTWERRLDRLEALVNQMERPKT